MGVGEEEATVEECGPPAKPNAPSTPAASSILEKSGKKALANGSRNGNGAPDVGLSYGFGGMDAALFDFNGTTDEIRFKQSPDFENPFASAPPNT